MSREHGVPGTPRGGHAPAPQEGGRTRPRVLGAVLAGGRSRRFGRDKALARLGGTTLLERAVATLDTACDAVVVVSGDPAHGIPGARRVDDLRPGRGPLGGIETALEYAASAGMSGVFVLACDLPGVTSGAVRRVLAEAGEAPAAAPARRGRPAFEPLAAWYALGCRPLVGRLLDEGVSSAHRLLTEAGGRVLPSSGEAVEPGGTDPFHNVNTPADLEAVRGTGGGS